MSQSGERVCTSVADSKKIKIVKNLISENIFSSKWRTKLASFISLNFCKYKEHWIKKHFSEECENNSKCKDKNKCQNRHPKACKRKGSGFCRLEGDCAYSHKLPPAQIRLKVMAGLSC